MSRAVLEQIIRHDQRVVAAALILVSLLAWAWLLSGAGMDMNAFEMTRHSLDVHGHAGHTRMDTCLRHPDVLYVVDNDDCDDAAQRSTGHHAGRSAQSPL